MIVEPYFALVPSASLFALKLWITFVYLVHRYVDNNKKPLCFAVKYTYNSFESYPHTHEKAVVYCPPRWLSLRVNSDEERTRKQYCAFDA